MKENIGWLYNKQYYETEAGRLVTAQQLERNNSNLIRKTYNRSHLLFLQTEWNEANERYRSFVLKVQYPGLITGTGINHQTTRSWKYDYHDRGNKKTKIVPEFKLGLHFDYTTGMPILPGSSVKGVLRDAFPIKNQKGRCEYEKEKCQYIAAALYLLSELEESKKNEERTIEKRTLTRLIEIYGKERYQESIQAIEAERENIYDQKWNELETKIDAGTISNEEFEAIVQTELDNKKNKILDTYFSSNRELRRRRNNIKPDIEQEIKLKYERELRSAFDRIGTDIKIPQEYISKAPLLALEIFEGKRNGKSLSVYEKDIFFDAIPVNGGEEGYLFDSDYITPHRFPLKDPEPICFIRIRPGVSFRFFFDLKDGIVSKELKQQLFKFILLEYGMGAKTNIGYGQFE